MKVGQRFSHLLFGALLIFFYSVSNNAQSGKLAGIVTDNTKSPLIGANIILEGTQLGAASDMDGYFSIINVRPGIYSVIFKYIGYQTKIVTDVRISSDKTTNLDITLEDEMIIGEQVVVVADKPIVEFNSTSSVVSVGKDEIDKLPVQNLDEIVNLQAGVVDGHFRGGRLGEVQYQVDGVSVNNPYNNSSSLKLDRSIIEEVQVISGTFDAKYGQAMSGVVNAVLRTGTDKFNFSGEFYIGDYYTTDTKRYPHDDKIELLNIYNLQATLSGPLPLPQTTFFISGQKYHNDGFLFGERRFMPTDTNDLAKKRFRPSGDNKLIPMTVNDELSGQFKINNRILKDFEFNYQGTINFAKRTNYDHSYRLNPDGIKTNRTLSLSHGWSGTHTISPELFYKVYLRQNYFGYTDYKYEDLFDPRYLIAGVPLSDQNYEDGAIVQGVDLGRFKQQTNSFILKTEVTWQFNRYNLVETGFEVQTSNLLFGSPGYFITSTIDGVSSLIPRVDNPRIPGVREYYPNHAAFYLQDRIELGDLVIRGGLRHEYFNASSKIPSDLANPANSITGAPESKLVDTKVKNSFAPRLGFSFPLTSSSSVYFSYGHFYQLPGLGLLYSNADYSLLDELQEGGISYGIMGNPDLKPEFTIQYEAGYKQSFGNSFGTEVSFFYKDIRDLLGVEFISTYAAADYARFTNVDFGGVYGVTLSLTKRDMGPLSASLDYTLQFASGNSSDPQETANRASSGKDPRPRTIPFNWDQRHTVNTAFIYFMPDNYSFTTIIRFGSGQPYTPEIGSGFFADLESNSGVKDSYFLLDFRAEKYFKYDILDFSVFFRGFNLLNTHFVNGFVFQSTGSPDYTLTPSSSSATLYDPSRFYEPRRFEIGVSFRSN